MMTPAQGLSTARVARLQTATLFPLPPEAIRALLAMRAAQAA
jgi:hypothetical protein